MVKNKDLSDERMLCQTGDDDNVECGRSLQVNRQTWPFYSLLVYQNTQAFKVGYGYQAKDREKIRYFLESNTSYFPLKKIVIIEK